MCESQKYDMEFEVRKRGFEINELNIAVNDLRGNLPNYRRRLLSSTSETSSRLSRRRSSPWTRRRQQREEKLPKLLHKCDEDAVHTTDRVDLSWMSPTYFSSSMMVCHVTHGFLTVHLLVAITNILIM